MTDVGLQRVLNEDNWGWMRLGEDIYLYVVADGMGGHESGEIASQTAVDRICRTARDGLSKLGGDATPETLESILDDAFQAANNAIKDMSERMGNDMGTTLVAALIYKNELALVANVGDSRAYLMRNSVLHQITRDHSLVARMVEQNRITPEEARHHPHSNILLRTVGTERNVDIDIFRVELEKNDRLLLCSDGLWGEVDDEDIEVILNHYPDPRVTCRELIRAAHHGGGKDNITVLIVLMPEA
jgi:protein phosphatase